MMIIFLSCLLFFCYGSVSAQQEFSPYELNGGLITAVAGRNYVLLATDTRMMDGSYEIYSRRHISSRLWNLPSSSSLANQDDEDESVEEWLTHVSKQQRQLQNEEPSSSSSSILHSSSSSSSPPVFIGSAGCVADCEALKRYMKMDSIAHSSRLCVSQVATMLSQTLYGRRSFPYYSFCIVAGCKNSNNDNDGGGSVYVYDAIGSYEQVAVASTGTGREQMQPILDRLFQSSITTTEDNDDDKDTTTWPAPPGVFPKVVPTQVDCSSAEALKRVTQAYHAVAEREIGVGDSIVVIITEKEESTITDDNERSKTTTSKDVNGKTKCLVYHIPLKQH